MDVLRNARPRSSQAASNEQLNSGPASTAPPLPDTNGDVNWDDLDDFREFFAGR
jgi:hypothetical protein